MERDNAVPVRGARPAVLQRRRLLAASIGATLALTAFGRAAASPRTETDPAEGAGEDEGRQSGTQLEKRPSFSDVSKVEPWDALLYLAGKDRRFPAASLDCLRGFSAADIIETMDTDVLDAVAGARGEAALSALYRLIANEALEALFTVYRGASVLLALDAGHGGRRGVYFDPGANGTEAFHTRAVASAIEERAADPRFASITVRRIFNDAIGDDFGLPPPEDRKSAASLTLRNARASMLAFEVDAWNKQNRQAQVALHVLSIHFNAGSGGILVLHQGDGVPEGFRARSIAYAEAYIGWARTTLNDAGILPYRLNLALGNGLSDDRVLYEPMTSTSRFNPYTGADRWSLPRRYAMLQDSPHQGDYALGALIYHGLI